MILQRNDSRTRKGATWQAYAATELDFLDAVSDRDSSDCRQFSVPLGDDAPAVRTGRDFQKSNT